MAKEIVISERDNIGAVFEDGKIVEFFMNEGEQLVGDIILGKVDSTITSIDAAFVNIGKNKNGFIHITDLAVKGPKKRTGIRNYLQLKQNLLVQIAKEATSSKGPRLTSMLTIPGKYLVLTPYERKIGISREIEDPYERDRLIFIAKNMCQSGYGIVLRSEAEYQSESALREDLDQLLKRWSEILSMSEKAIAPAVLYRDQDLLYKVLRDALTPDVQKIIVDSPEAKARAIELLQSWSNDSFRLVQQNKSNVSLALQYNLFNELEKALQTKVVLPGGGYLIIEKTEALTVIDVNSGGTRDTNSLSETILKTNKEAAVEIARQLRLRDIGGVIVVDFIDMFDQREQQIVWQILANAVKSDKSQPQLGYFSEFSLLEMTRHRQKKSLTELLTSKCPYCDGVGKLRNSVYRSDLLNNDSIIRRTATFDNGSTPKIESFLQKPKEDLIENVEYFEKQVPPPQYEAYKKNMKVNDFTYVNNYVNNNNDVNDSIEIEYTPVEKTTVVVETPKPQSKTPVHHNKPHKEKMIPKEEIISEIVEDVNLDFIEEIPLSNEIEVQETQKPNVFIELSDEERKYIQSIDHRGGNPRRDRFNKDKKNFNDRKNPRNDRFEKEPKYNDSIEKSNYLEEKPSFVEPIIEKPILLPVIEKLVKEVLTPEPAQITEIINENNELIRKVIHVEPIISVEPAVVVDDVIESVLPQIKVMVEPFLELSHSVEEHIVSESILDDEPKQEVVNLPKKRGRKPKKKVEEVQEVKPEPKEELPELAVVEKIQEKEEILKEKINDLIQTVLNPEVIDKVEVKKKKPRRIRSFSPPKKKK